MHPWNSTHDALSSGRMWTSYGAQEPCVITHKLFYFHTDRWFWMAFCNYTWASPQPIAIRNEKTSNQRYSHIACSWFKAHFNRHDHPTPMSNATTEKENLLRCHFHNQLMLLLLYIPSYRFRGRHRLYRFHIFGYETHMIRNKNTFRESINFMVDKYVLFMQFNWIIAQCSKAIVATLKHQLAWHGFRVYKIYLKTRKCVNI